MNAKTDANATDARTAPVAVWSVLEKMSKEERVKWRVAELDDRRPVEERSLDVGFAFGWYPMMLSYSRKILSLL